MSKLVLRRVFEIGSGSIKCVVGYVDLEHGIVEKCLFKSSRQVLFLSSMARSGLISTKVFQEGRQVLQHLLEQTSGFGSLGELPTRGVATEVFRKAENGRDIVEGLATNFVIKIISSEEEAEYGFKCALAHIKKDIKKEDLVAWDCGAGSFQFKSQCGSYYSPNGSGTMLELAVQLTQNIATSTTPNPVSPEVLKRLETHLSNSLKPFPAWVSRESSYVLAIGSAQSIFSQQVLLGSKKSFTLTEVDRTLASLVDLSDDDLYKLEKGRIGDLPNDMTYNVKSENSPYIIPKLVLLATVMRNAKIERVHHEQTIGICSGLLICEELWG